MPPSMPRSKMLRVGDEQIVAHQLDLLAERVGQQLPAVPIVFGHAVFDRDDGRILAHPVGPELHHLLAGALALVGLLEDVLAVLEELAGGRVEADADLLAGLVAGLRDGFEHALDGFLVRLQIGREAALVAHRGRVALLAEHLLQRVEDFDAHAQRFAEARRAEGRDHEFLQVDRVVGMRAAVDDVHHRHGQGAGADAAQVAIERSALRQRPPRAPPPWRRPGSRWRPGVPCSACRRARSSCRSISACWRGVLAVQRRGDLAIDMARPPSACPCPGSAPCRRRAVPRLRARRWMRRMARPPVPCCRRRDRHRLPQSDSRANPESLFQLLLQSSSKYYSSLKLICGQAGSLRRVATRSTSHPPR